MAVLSSSELLEAVKQKQMVLPHLDVAGGNLDIFHAICRVLKETGCGAILASTPASIKSYYGYEQFVELSKYDGIECKRAECELLPILSCSPHITT